MDEGQRRSRIMVLPACAWAECFLRQMGLNIVPTKEFIGSHVLPT